MWEWAEAAGQLQAQRERKEAKGAPEHVLDQRAASQLRRVATGHHRDAEQRRNLTFRAAGGMLTEIRGTADVRGEPGIGKELGHPALDVGMSLVEAQRGAWMATVGPCGVHVLFVHREIDPVDSQRSGVGSWRRMLLPGLRIRSRGLRAEPDGGTNHQAQAEDPDEHALGDRSEVAKVHAAGVLVLVQLVQVADDVVLVSGGQIGVVEDRHRLRSRHHCLVDVRAGDVAKARRVLATSQCATRAGEVVAHRTVDLEQLVAVSDIAIALGELVIGNRRAGAERRHVCGQRRDLRIGELDLLAGRGLNPRPGQRHTARADLEVNGCSAHTGQAGGVFGALGVQAMTGGAVGQEQHLACAHVISRGRRGICGLYTLPAPQPAHAATATADDVSAGKMLFLANCATCHGLHAQGTKDAPSLAGVGAAAVDFQVGTGRMPLAGPGVQAAASKKIKFTDAQIASLAAYVASLSPGPAIPDDQFTKGDGNIAHGNELFKVNCAMCHNFAGSGGALTRGKYAPSLRNVTGTHIYEAMVSGPQSMPVFNDANLSPTDKNDIISYLHELDKNKNPGGMNLGNLGPVSEGMFIWVFGLGLVVGAAVWLGAKAA